MGFRQLAYNDTLRLAGAAEGDGEGMGRPHSLSELFSLYGGRTPDKSTVVCREMPGIRTTQLVLSNFVLPVTTVTTGNGVGGVKIYDFPEGYIQRHYCRALLSVTAEDTDVIDADAAGDVGIGSAAPADADALGTDASDDDWGTAVAIALVAGVDASVIVAPEAAAVVDGSSTPADLYLNALIDAADMDDGATSNLLVSGNIWFTWGWLGD